MAVEYPVLCVTIRTFMIIIWKLRPKPEHCESDKSKLNNEVINDKNE